MCDEVKSALGDERPSGNTWEAVVAGGSVTKKKERKMCGWLGLRCVTQVAASNREQPRAQECSNSE